MNTLSIKLLKPLLNILENHRWMLFGIIYAFGVGVYGLGCGHAWYASAYEGLALFAMNVTTSGVGCDVWVYVAGFLAAFYTVISIISLIAKRYIDQATLHEATQHSYILVCGLGVKAAAYIESELAHDNDANIIVMKFEIRKFGVKFGVRR